MSWQDEYIQMVEDCENRESRLTEWEASFIDSMRNLLGSEVPPTAKQLEKLDEIWERATAKG